MNLMILFMMTIIISSLLLSVNFLLSKKMTLNREKKSPFECGFDPMSSARLPFSVHFFLISLIFLIFDVEIALLIPSIKMFSIFNSQMLITIFFFLFSLISGLYIEYMEKSIDWKM